MSFVVPFDGNPENRAVESSKLATNQAELFPCGIVFLALSTIDKKLLFLTALFAGTKKSR
ncbi:TPA: hypothetical protein ACPJCO_000216 [Haemophilus influenzae]|uniref:Uncharacterized protein n=1 Tax=Haemophilus influenzae 22.4-21 TaxID=375063 RepID=A4P0J1_HAEIF|nr:MULTISPECIES: hypothetical protein [Haemophilus]EDK13067.1 hypothetical protein CGSHiR3021_00272 [Haemophilus influenzae 22.4-21]AXP41788.1 hypothetical protein CH611_06170 [Haemophilus influenzae]AXP58119.1 hypothetical protein CH556_06175 [Haemophilus influenzae]MCK8803833.1 hypothetical protein [Haemophilus influenzae]MCK8896428.1 hypothetical protein [Haemophilus influenzae]